MHVNGIVYTRLILLTVGNSSQSRHCISCKPPSIGSRYGADTLSTSHPPYSPLPFLDPPARITHPSLLGLSQNLNTNNVYNRLRVYVPAHPVGLRSLGTHTRYTHPDSSLVSSVRNVDYWFVTERLRWCFDVCLISPRTAVQWAYQRVKATLNWKT